MSNEVFVVGCGGVGFHNGIVLLDLMGLSLVEKDLEGRPVRELNTRVVMTADGLVETFNALQGMMNKLVEVGVLQRGDASAAVPMAEATVKPAATGPSSNNGGQPKSPNF